MVMSPTGGMGKEMQIALKHLANKIAEKRKARFAYRHFGATEACICLNAFCSCLFAWIKINLSSQSSAVGGSGARVVTTSL